MEHRGLFISFEFFFFLLCFVFSLKHTFPAPTTRANECYQASSLYRVVLPLYLLQSPWISAVNVLLTPLCCGNVALFVMSVTEDVGLCRRKQTLQMLQFPLTADGGHKSLKFPLSYCCIFACTVDEICLSVLLKGCLLMIEHMIFFLVKKYVICVI